MKERTTRIHILPDGSSIFEESAFTIEVEDEGAGEFLVLSSNEEACREGQIRIDSSDWPFIRDAMDRMFKEIKE